MTRWCKDISANQTLNLQHDTGPSYQYNCNNKKSSLQHYFPLKPGFFTLGDPVKCCVELNF